MDPILLDAIEYNGGGINTLLNRGAVKSVQRGIFANQDLSHSEERLPIVQVNQDKSVLLTELTYSGNAAGAGSTSVYLENGQNVVLKHQGSNMKTSLSWQVIEFY